MSSYIVIVSPSYGGAEKRFFDIFTGLRRSDGDVLLVAPESLVENFKVDYPERQDVFKALVGVPMYKWGRLAFISSFRQFLLTLPCGNSYHYPVNCLWPLHLGRGDRVTMSMVDCTRVPSLFGGTLASAWGWLSFFFVSRIDVLSPSIYSAMRQYRTSSKMSLTPGGTYLAPLTGKTVSKTPTVVFLGRLVPGKGVEDFLNVLPDVWEGLRGFAPEMMSFEIAGYGSLEKQVKDRVAELVNLGVPISFVGYVTADKQFSTSAIVLSMQDITNYPSRVVAEALMSGCAVIVRDTGDSRQFGENIPGLLYCNAKLDARELADQIKALLERILHEPEFQEEVRRAARNQFSASQYIDYFRTVTGSNPISQTQLPQD